MNPLRVGILGCGNVMVHYMEVLQKLQARGLASPTWACDRAEAKRRQMKDEFGVERFTTDWREVVEAKDVDLVLVLTPMQDHAAAAGAALRAGKHVLVEKTMAQNLEEARRLVALAREGPAYLACAPHVVLSPTYQAMWRQIRRGRIGKPVSARARYGWADPYWEGGWVYQRGAGSLFEFGVYNVTSLTGLLGPARQVAAMTAVALPEREIGGTRVRVEADDTAQLLLDFGEGVLAVVTTGFTLQRYRSPAIEIYGTRGTIQMLGDDWAPRGYELWENDASSWKVYDETDPGWPWTDGLRHLVECIHAKTRPLVRPEHAFHVLEILLKGHESARDGRARPIESAFDLTLPDVGGAR